MKKNITKVMAALLAILMIASLTACVRKPNEELEINVYLLNGTTALGASKMVADEKADSDSMNYKFEIFAAADAITGAIISGEADIAAEIEVGDKITVTFTGIATKDDPGTMYGVTKVVQMNK